VLLDVAPTTTELARLLGEELGLYDQLLVLTRREREAVLGGDPSALEALVAEKEALIAQVGRVEARRQQWLADWAAEAGLDPAGLTLAGVSARLGAAAAAELDAAREELVARVRELAELGFRNRNLLSSALGVVSRRLDAYNRVTTAHGYRASGATIKSPATAQLDLRA
jgi:flagellar biosynthesis/type III secretory pathway chaperone